MKTTQQQIPDIEFLDLKNTAKFLKIAVSTCYKLTHFKKIRHFKPNGNKILFLKSDVIAFAMRNCIETNETIELQAQKYAG